jgi:hypothetical protein
MASADSANAVAEDLRRLKSLVSAHEAALALQAKQHSFLAARFAALEASCGSEMGGGGFTPATARAGDRAGDREKGEPLSAHRRDLLFEDTNSRADVTIVDRRSVKTRACP